jgi:CRISPR/Cas system CSM-associated protein Csm3 (group 7 of RAMP superfamily)
LLETLIAASREFLERQQRDKQENVCTSSAFFNNDLHTQQHNTELLSDNAAIASSSAHTDEAIVEQNFLKNGNEEPEKMSISGCENDELFDNFKDEGNSGKNNGVDKVRIFFVFFIVNCLIRNNCTIIYDPVFVSHRTVEDLPVSAALPNIYNVIVQNTIMTTLPNQMLGNPTLIFFH